jgi:hypothetical protein
MVRRLVVSALGVVVGAALVIQGLSAPAGASVSNPGSVTFVVDSLSISIGSVTASYDASASPSCSDGVDDPGDTDTLADYPADPQCTSAADDSEIKPGAQPHVLPKFVGTITGAGAISVPTSGATLPVFYIENSSAGGDGVVTVTPRLAQTATGTLSPDTGAMTLRLKLLVDLDATNLGSSCAVGSTTTPIDMTALATTTSGGSAYSTSTGAATLVDRTYSVPSSSNCGLAAGSINNALGLPSGSGNNVASFAMHSTPVLAPGVATTTSSSTTTPSTTGGSTTSTTVKPSTTTTTGGTRFTWPWQTTTTTVPRTTSTTRATTTTTTRSTTTTIGGPVTTTTTRPWWCTWCR